MTTGKDEHTLIFAIMWYVDNTRFYFMTFKLGRWKHKTLIFIITFPKLLQAAPLDQFPSCPTWSRRCHWNSISKKFTRNVSSSAHNAKHGCMSERTS